MYYCTDIFQFKYNFFQAVLMHSVEKKELICENRSSKIEETQKEIIENYPQLPQGKKLGAAWHYCQCFSNAYCKHEQWKGFTSKLVQFCQVLPFFDALPPHLPLWELKSYYLPLLKMPFLHIKTKTLSVYTNILLSYIKILPVTNNLPLSVTDFFYLMGSAHLTFANGLCHHRHKL